MSSSSSKDSSPKKTYLSSYQTYYERGSKSMRLAILNTQTAARKKSRTNKIKASDDSVITQLHSRQKEVVQSKTKKTSNPNNTTHKKHRPNWNNWKLCNLQDLTPAVGNGRTGLISAKPSSRQLLPLCRWQHKQRNGEILLLTSRLASCSQVQHRWCWEQCHHLSICKFVFGSQIISPLDRSVIHFLSSLSISLDRSING